MKSLHQQKLIYLNGFAGKRPNTPISYEALAHRAEQYLSPEAFAYLAGGAGRESTISLNRAALDRIRILPHMLKGVPDVSLQKEWNNLTLPAPVMFAPIGVLELAHRRGDLELADAARQLGIPMIISSQASFPMEQIAERLGDCPRLFQLYYSRSKELSQSFIRRAEAIDAKAIIVTLDTTLLGWRVRDLELGYSPFLHGRGIAQYWSDPVFQKMDPPETDNSIKPPLSFSLIKNLVRLNARIPGNSISNLTSGKGLNTVRKFTNVFTNPGINWSDIELIRSWTDLPIYLKGILRPDDAIKALHCGVNGLIVSNHGGRQVDGAIASVEALPHILDIVNGRIEVWVDSGVRTGNDVFKCLALGATGVCIGRPYAYALAVNGQRGVIDFMENLLAELELTMALSGCGSLEEIKGDLISSI